MVKKVFCRFVAEVLRKFMSRGNSIVYLPRIIEYLEIALNRNPKANIDELANYVSTRLEVKIISGCI